MTYCLNPTCPAPENPDTHRFCHRCGWRLRLGDRYEAIHPLGIGQHSRTFLGRDRTVLVKPQCLIKRFIPIGNTRPDRDAAAERFRKDMAHLATASQHPQIPDLLGYFERQQQQFLIQQFLVGAHLEQQLQEKRGPFDSPEVWGFLQDVLPILQHLHSHKIIHRDIKPTNFRRLPDQPHWWLVDLGVAKPLTATRMAQPGTLVGSAEYAAPEQLRGEATYASDIYSLGVVCLYLLTGLSPFALFHGGQGCWYWRSIVPDLDDRLATLIDSMVQPALRDRIASVKELMALGSISNPIPASLPAISHPSSHSSSQHWQAAGEIDVDTEILKIAPLPHANLLLVLTTPGLVEVRSLHPPHKLLTTLTSRNAAPITLATHPYHPCFALGARQGAIEIWQFKQGTWHYYSLPKHLQAITQLVFTPSGETLISADKQGGIYQWDWVEGTMRLLGQDHVSAITCLALSRSGQTLASGDTQGNVKLWYLPTGEYLRTFSRQAGAITALCWLIDDQALITASWDVTVRWCCPDTGNLWLVIKAQGFYLPVRSLLAHPTQPQVVTGSQDGKLQYWPVIPDNRSTMAPIEAMATATPKTSAIIGICLLSSDSQAHPALLSATQAGQLTWRSL